MPLRKSVPRSILSNSPQPTPLEERLITVGDAAKTLSVSKKTIFRRMENGTIPYLKDGSLVRIPYKELNRFISERMVQNA
jgi:excisionase family DNA binding protein